MTKYSCCDPRRLNAVRAHPTLNGIEFVEVSDDPADPTSERQRTLFVHFVKPLEADAFGIANVRVEGGERIVNPPVTGLPVAQRGPNSPGSVLTVRVREAGDHSTYRLRLVRGVDDARQPENFDPVLSSIEFSFKVACPTDFDCEQERICLPEPKTSPEINYLAKDYASFRQLMLDRLSVLMPRWKERNPADTGIALVELLAYVGDYLSYRQDAIATESYLGTARRRVSVARHARLVDYHMHNGSNARAWVQVKVAGDMTLPPRTQILSRLPGMGARIAPDSAEHERALNARPVVFETLQEEQLYVAHNEMEFYTWGDERCCLPKGATVATLNNTGGLIRNLEAGDVLILIEQRNPSNGKEEEANPAHRHAVRLVEVNHLTDPLFTEDTEDEAITQELRLIRVRWHDEDALPFPLCLWDVEDSEGAKLPVSVALGNIVLADHGETVRDEQLGTMPEANDVLTKVRARGHFCEEETPKKTAPRFRPQLQKRPLTYAVPHVVAPDAPLPSASALMNFRAADALPAIVDLRGRSQDTSDEEAGDVWEAQRDLINSGQTDKHFVVEVETDGTATLRFGDEQFGSRPAAGTRFTATYRVGGGTSGNVGALALAHVVTGIDGIEPEGVGNPLPARGGTEPESIEEVRRDAPAAFRTQERAVTADDYARVAERHAGVQRAAATFRWTGSWRTVFLTVDRLGGAKVDPEFEEEVRLHLERYRMAGHDVEIDEPRYVSLEIEMKVCVKPEYFRGDVKKALLEIFSDRVLAGGKRGLFHPDNFTFGQTVYLSALYAAAQSVEGVESVEITKFVRQGVDDPEPLTTGELQLERLEIARLDADPNFPEHGVFHVEMRGGR